LVVVVSLVVCASAAHAPLHFRVEKESGSVGDGPRQRDSVTTGGVGRGCGRGYGRIVGRW
jgi:hypothetical protein